MLQLLEETLFCWLLLKVPCNGFMSVDVDPIVWPSDWVLGSNHPKRVTIVIVIVISKLLRHELRGSSRNAFTQVIVTAARPLHNFIDFLNYSLSASPELSRQRNYLHFIRRCAWPHPLAFELICFEAKSVNPSSSLTWSYWRQKFELF